MSEQSDRFIACFEQVVDFACAVLGRLPTTAELVDLHTSLLDLEIHYRRRRPRRRSA